MKNVIFTLAATTVLLLSCSKDNDNVEPQVLGDSGDRAAAPTVFVSNWAPVTNWNASERNGMKVYSTTITDSRINNDILSRGAVLVFVKGTNFSSGNFEFEPNSLPWDQYIPWERMAYPYHWTPDVKDGQVTVSIAMHPEIEADYLKYRSSVQTRYFVLTEAFLRQHNLVPSKLQEYSYKQIVSMAGTTP